MPIHGLSSKNVVAVMTPALLEMSRGLPGVVDLPPRVTDRVITARVDGRLFSVESEAALVVALDDILASPKQAAAMGAHARRTKVDRYAIDRIADRCVDLCRLVCA